MARSRRFPVCNAGMGIGFRPEIEEPALILPDEKELDLPTDFGLSLRQMAALGLAGEERERRVEPVPVSPTAVLELPLLDWNCPGLPLVCVGQIEQVLISCVM